MLRRVCILIGAFSLIATTASAQAKGASWSGGADGVCGFGASGETYWFWTLLGGHRRRSWSAGSYAVLNLKSVVPAFVSS